MNSITLNNRIPDAKVMLLSAIALVAISIIFSEYIFFLIAITLVLLLYNIFGEKFLYVFILVTLFTLVSDVSGSLRTYIQLFDIGLLGILFLKRYGIDFERYPRIPKAVLYLVILYYISMVISVMSSNYMQPGIFLILRQTVFFIIVYFLYALIKNENDVRLYLFALIISALVLALATILMFLTEGTTFFDLATGFRGRTSSLISNPNAATTFYMVTFPIILSYLLIDKDKKRRILLNIVLFIFSIALILTMSRSALLGILISTLILFFVLRRNFFKRMVVVLVSILFVIIVSGAFADFFTLLLRIEAGLTGRDHLWTISTNIIKDYFVFGIGPGSYKYVWMDYFPVMLGSWSGGALLKLHSMAPDTNLSHNFYLMFFSDMGLPGLLTAISLTAIYFNIGVKTVKEYKNEPNPTFYLVVALFASGASVFARVFSDSIGLLSYGAITADLPFWLVFMSLLIMYNSKLNE